MVCVRWVGRQLFFRYSAVKKIQSVWRGHLARRHLNIVRERLFLKQRNEAAAKIAG